MIDEFEEDQTLEPRWGRDKETVSICLHVKLLDVERELWPYRSRVVLSKIYACEWSVSGSSDDRWSHDIART